MNRTKPRIYIAPDQCTCGRSGFLLESNAERYAAAQRLDGLPIATVRCPAGNCWHYYNENEIAKERYLDFLQRNQGNQELSIGRPVLPAHLAATIGQQIAAREPATEAAPPLPTPPPETGARKGCVKIGFARESMARAALAIAMAQGPAQGRRERTCYVCPTCGRWHLTSRDPAHTPESVRLEEYVAYVASGDEWRVSAARFPDGGLAYVQIAGGQRSIRIAPEHLAAVRLALDAIAEDEDDDEDDE